MKARKHTSCSFPDDTNQCDAVTEQWLLLFNSALSDWADDIEVIRNAVNDYDFVRAAFLIGRLLQRIDSGGESATIMAVHDYGLDGINAQIARLRIDYGPERN